MSRRKQSGEGLGVEEGEPDAEEAGGWWPRGM